MRKIFINYRRADAEYAAGALGRELRRHFGDEQVFRDKENIGGGVSWRQEVLHEIDRDSALLVLIGRGWADAKDAHGARRLDDNGDPLRLEIAVGLRDGAAILPILLENAAMPAEEELPAELRPLAGFNAIRLRDSDWQYDLDNIRKTLQRIGFRPVHALPQPAAEQEQETPFTAKKSVAGLVMGAIGAVLLAISFLALLSPGLDREGHIGAAVFSFGGLVLGVWAWLNNRRLQSGRRILSIVVSVFAVVGIFAALRGIDSKPTPPQSDSEKTSKKPGEIAQVTPPAGGATPGVLGVKEEGVTSIALLRGHAVFRYNSKVWRVESQNAPESGVFQLDHTNDEVWFKVIAERVPIGMEKLAEIGLAQIKKQDPKAKVTRQGSRSVNGLNMVFREIEVNFNDLPWTFYNHYYSDSSGSIQFVGWTSRSLLKEHRSTIENLLDGFEITAGQGEESARNTVPAVGATPEVTASRSSELTSVPLLKGHAVIRYNPTVWQVDTRDATKPGEFQYVHTSGEVWFKVIAERIQIGTKKLAEIGLAQIKKQDPRAKVTRQGSRTVNGLNMAFREIEVTFNDIPMTFYNHYYSDSSGSIQLCGWTGRSLSKEHRSTIEEFLEGFQITD